MAKGKGTFFADLRRTLLDLGGSDHQALELEERLRAAWGGRDVYIGRRSPDAETARLAGALRQGVPVLQAFAAAGVPRRTGYRRLRRPARRGGGAV